MNSKKKYTKFICLMELVATLRGENGCPWDKKQTHKSMASKFVEEAYEFLDAVRKRDYNMMQDELGDLLLNILLHSEIAAQDKNFDIGDVMDNLCQKIVRRHPHVFGAEKRTHNTVELTRQWEEIKRSERLAGQKRTSLDARFSTTFPSLLRLYKFMQFWVRTNDGVTIKECKDVKKRLNNLIKNINVRRKNSKRQKEKIIEELLFLSGLLACEFQVDPEMLLQHKVDVLIRKNIYSEKN